MKYLTTYYYQSDKDAMVMSKCGKWDDLEKAIDEGKEMTKADTGLHWAEVHDVSVIPNIKEWSSEPTHNGFPIFGNE